MFSFLKPDPIKKLRKEYDAKLEQGMQAQRKGDIKSYAMLTDEAEKIWNETWDEALSVNLIAPCNLMRNAVPHFRNKGGGIIITISSWVAHKGPGFPSMIAYSATKSAVMNATKTVAKHYALENIFAYIIAPGVVRTRMSEEFAKTTNGGEDAITKTLAMQEWVPPSELGDLVTYLSLGSCRHLTGATLDVNGASYLR